MFKDNTQGEETDIALDAFLLFAQIYFESDTDIQL